MPALPDVNKCLRVVLQHNYGTDIDVISRFFVQYAGVSPTSAQLDTWCSDMATNWGTNVAPITSNTVTLANVYATDLSSPLGYAGESPAGIGGGLTGLPLSADACGVIAYEIGRRYRGGHPRGYWPVGDALYLSEPQTWSDTFVGLMFDAFSGFFSELLADPWTGAGTLTQVNVSYYQGFQVITNPITGRARNVPTVREVPQVDQVLTLTARARVGSQRRRLGKS
jgi:hypothetical protein